MITMPFTLTRHRKPLHFPQWLKIPYLLHQCYQNPFPLSPWHQGVFHPHWWHHLSHDIKKRSLHLNDINRLVHIDLDPPAWLLPFLSRCWHPPITTHRFHSDSWKPPLWPAENESYILCTLHWFHPLLWQPDNSGVGSGFEKVRIGWAAIQWRRQLAGGWWLQFIEKG